MTLNIVRVSDLATRPGLTLESRDDRLSMNAPLLTGTLVNRELRRGLHIHCSDVFEEADFVATSEQRPGLSCVFFLAGNVGIDLGGREFHFRGSGTLQEGLTISSARSESFRRFSHGHQRIRHLVVSASPEWLDRDGLGSVSDHRPAESMLASHLSSCSWRVTPRLTRLVNEVLAAEPSRSAFADLMMESAAVQIVAEALAAATGQQPSADRHSVTQPERARVERVEQLINDSPMLPTVEEIAAQAGVSVSGLQRLFRATHGESVLEHARRVRLEKVRAQLELGQLSIKQAAASAGYTSAANFATAFKRQFGISPSEARTGGKRVW